MDDIFASNRPRIIVVFFSRKRVSGIGSEQSCWNKKKGGGREKKRERKKEGEGKKTKSRFHRYDFELNVASRNVADKLRRAFHIARDETRTYNARLSP